MTQTLTEPLGVFQKVFDGELITGDHPAYDSVRALWNTEIDRHPAVIARCTKPTDVASAVTFGREQGLEIAVRCGSHNAAGTASCDGGLMIDLSLMRSLSVDPRSRRVRVAGGALLGDMDAATQAHGLATTAGTVSPHRRRRAHPRRRIRLAGPPARAGGRQPALRRGGHG